MYPSNFHRWLSHGGGFRKYNKIADRMGYVGGRALWISKKITSPILRGCGGKVYRGVNRDVGRLSRQACLLMYASNIDRQCCIVPPLRGTDRGTIENYSRSHPKVLQNTPYPVVRGLPSPPKNTYPLSALAFSAPRRGMLPPRRGAP